MTEDHLPFKVGHLVETKSFEEGFRGAWFRCEIIDIKMRRNELSCNLKYLDFPDEKIHITKFYQKQTSRGKKQLMVRPKYPLLYNVDEAVDIGCVLETSVVVNNNWKVGDLVDWWRDDCYWCGTIVEVMGNRRIKVKLFPVPIGEGNCYEAHCNDIRPSLDWSPAKGWTLPLFEDGESIHCAKLLKPAKECEAIEDYDDKEDGFKEDMKKEDEFKEHTKKEDHGSSLALNITASGATDAAVLDLEELVSRIKWLKALLASNSKKSSSTSTTWNFVEYHSS